MAESTSNFSYRIALKWVLNFRWTTITCPLDWVTSNHWAWWWPAGYALLSQNKHSSSNAIGMCNATSHCQQFLREVSHWFCLKSIRKRCNYSFLRRYNRLVLQCVSSLMSPSAFLVNTKSGKNEKKFFEIVRWHAALKVCKSPKMTAINRLSFFHGNLSWIFFCPEMCLLRFVNNKKKNRLFCIETWGFDTFFHYNEAFILLCWVLALQLHFIWLLWTKEFAFGEKKIITKHIC